MSQTYNMPMASSSKVLAGRTTINDAFDALLTTFIGTSLPGSPSDGQLAILDDSGGSGNYLLEARIAGAWYVIFPDLAATKGGGLLYADGTVALTGDLACGTNKLTGMGDPTADQDAATKIYVDDKPGKVAIAIGNLTASTNLYVFITDAVATEIVEAHLLTDAADPVDAANYWTANIQNLTDAQALLANAKTNQSGATNSEAITADTAWSFDFATEGQNSFDALAAGKVLELQITKTGSATDLTNVVFVLSTREKTA